MSHDELKHLETKKNTAKQRLEEKLLEIKRIKLELQLEKDEEKTREIKLRQKKANFELQQIEKELSVVRKGKKRLSEENGGILISEHAILRYLERVKGIDIEQIKKEMIPNKVREQIEKLKTGNFPVENYKLRVKNMTVVTLVRD